VRGMDDEYNSVSTVPNSYVSQEAFAMKNSCSEVEYGGGWLDAALEMYLQFDQSPTRRE